LASLPGIIQFVASAVEISLTAIAKQIEAAAVFVFPYFHSLRKFKDTSCIL
jgi:hypothetical protein